MTHRYAPDLMPLRLEHAYLRGAPRSAYWSVAPYLIQQETASSCSLATAVMLLNAVRGQDGHLASAGPVSEASLLDRMADDSWRHAVAQNGGGLSLSEFAVAMQRALQCYDCAARWEVAITPVVDADAALGDLRAALIEMESGSAFAAANFHLDLFYGDGVDVGHFSPIGAYDAARDRVLMLDVYKKEYEPVWAPLPRLATAMATHSRKTGEPRGYAMLRRR